MRKHVFPLLLIALTIIAWYIAWPHLPGEVPSHINVSGEVDGYMSKMGMMILDVAVMLFIYVLAITLPKLDPKYANYGKFSKAYMMMTGAILLFLFASNMMGLANALGYNIPIGIAVNIMVGILFVVIGNYMQQCKPNFFMGIKTPWTLSSEEVWRKTHRLGSKIMMIGGIAIMISAFLPGMWKIISLLSVTAVLVVGTMVYSYVAYKKELKM
ncbi:SdpI family protein [Bacillus sp. Brlt_9]|uniref:SdpI family protein n=1 Tax=Bacillus sp. Brlt_9 TaxID=3110916 RepID=UPI003F7B4E3F